jgi:hypothetical protein
MARARELAMAGRAVEAGRKYQTLLVATQVLAYAVAIHSMAQYADARMQAGWQIGRTQERFAAEAEPIFRAALNEDPGEIQRALDAHPEVFAGWARLLEQWPGKIDDAAHKVEVANVVWDIAFLAVAAYEAAGAAAEIALAGRPPMPPFPVLASGGGAAAAGLSGAASLEMAEAIRKLIAIGGLDASVVAAISRTTGSGATASPAAVPGLSQMSKQERPVPATGTTGGNPAYQTARAGGRHAGTLANYAGRSTAEIQKAIESYERQVALHEQKIADPSRFADRWERMTAMEREGLIRHWQQDIARNKELADVLRGLLESR